MTTRKTVVEAYIDGFRRTDHEAVLACLTEDVEWVLHGYRTLRGKAEFAGEIKNDAGTGAPELHLERLVEEGDTVVAVGRGRMVLRDAGDVGFVFSEVFTFTGDLVSRLETFHINLVGDTLFTIPEV